MLLASEEIGRPPVPRSPLEVMEAGDLGPIRHGIPRRDKPAASRPYRGTRPQVDVRDGDIGRRHLLVQEVEQPRIHLDAVRRGVPARGLDGRLVEVDRENGRIAEARRRDRDYAGAAAEIDETAPIQLLEQLEAELCRWMRACAERSPGIDHD